VARTREICGVASEAERFWSKVKRGKSGECWPWVRATNEKGYGCAWFKEKLHKAHRVAWMLGGKTIPAGLCLLHRCDNPPCCNPAHLFLGTKGDNHRDMTGKGRGSAPPPMGGWNRLVLPPEIVAQFGCLPDWQLAQKASVNKSTIARARRRAGIKSFAEATGASGQFKPGNFPARWRSRGEVFSNHPR
jgi:hypothetical protein